MPAPISSRISKLGTAGQEAAPSGADVLTPEGAVLLVGSAARQSLELLPRQRNHLLEVTLPELLCGGWLAGFELPNPVCD
jgi:hypothetical protein